MLKAIICSIGDEIIDGRTLDTNTSKIAKFLTEQGIEVCQHISIRDQSEDIINFFTKDHSADVIITTGGLGPTRDDITREAIAQSFQRQFIIDQKWLDHLSCHWNFPKEKLISQSMLPEDAHLIPNRNGTSCGFIFFEKTKSCYYAFLPGVPSECLGMLDLTLDFFLQESIELAESKPLSLYLHGIYERDLNQTLEEIVTEESLQLSWGLYPGFYHVQLYLYGAIEHCHRVQQKLLEIYKEHVFSGDFISDFVSSIASKNWNLTIDSEQRCGVYLYWLVSKQQRDFSIDLESYPQHDSLHISLKFNDSSKMYQLECLFQEKILLQLEKKIVGTDQDLLCQKSAHWALSSLLLWLESR